MSIEVVFSLLGAFAEFECDIWADRQRDGVAKAKSAGVTFGRQKALTDEQIERVQFLRNEQKLSASDFATVSIVPSL